LPTTPKSSELLNFKSVNAVGGIDPNTLAGAQRCREIFSTVGNRPAELAARDLAYAHEDSAKAREVFNECRRRYADAKKANASAAALALLKVAETRVNSLKEPITVAFKTYCMRASDPSERNNGATLLLSALASEALNEDKDLSDSESDRLTTAATAAREASKKAELELQTRLRAERAAAAASGAAAAAAEAKAAKDRHDAAALREKDAEARLAATRSAADVRAAAAARAHLSREIRSGRIEKMLDAALPPARKKKVLSPEQERISRERRLEMGLPATKEEGRLRALESKAAKQLRAAAKAGAGGKTAIAARAKELAEASAPKDETAGDKAARIAALERSLTYGVSGTSAREGKSSHGVKARGGGGGW
jgi:hypothetical protein